MNKPRAVDALPPPSWFSHVPFAAGCLLLVAALAFGGGAKGVGDAPVHGIAVVAFAAASWRWHLVALDGLQKATLWILLAALLLGTLQLLPLSQAAFSHLPQRAQVLTELRDAGFAESRMPMTLDRWGTVRAMLALFSFLAMWMLCTTLSSEGRNRLLYLAVALAVPMALLGFAQASSKLDTTGANGLFENRNHYATLMAMLVPFAFAAATQARERNAVAMGVAWYGAIVVLLLAAALSFSRVGSVLALVSATTALVLVRGAAGRGLAPQRGALSALGVAGLAGAYFASDRLFLRFGSSLLDDLRWQYLDNGWEVLKAYFPWGSGLGSFRQVYAQFEPMQSLGEYTFANHAHNELLQNGIEGGLPAMLLMGAFGGVVLMAAARTAGAGLQGDYWRRAALISVGVATLHSLVDYPLRTLACSTVLALALAVLLAGGASGDRARMRKPPHPDEHLQ